jgi:hypothetical protein
MKPRKRPRDFKFFTFFWPGEVETSLVLGLEVAAAIGAQNDLDELTRLFEAALTAPSLGEFRAALEK